MTYSRPGSSTDLLCARLQRITLIPEMVLDALLMPNGHGFTGFSCEYGTCSVHVLNQGGGRFGLIVDVSGNEEHLALLDGHFLVLIDDHQGEQVAASSLFAGGRAALLGLDPSVLGHCFLLELSPDEFGLLAQRRDQALVSP